jgi:hypothetical protein
VGKGEEMSVRVEKWWTGGCENGGISLEEW